MVVFGIIGFIASLLLLLSANFVSSKILNVPDVSYVLKVLSPAIFFVCVSAVIRGYFAGLGTMKASSISQALEQFFNCVLKITFVYALIGKEPYIMAAGGNLSTTLAILISFSYLIVFYKKNIKEWREESDDVVITTKEENKKMVKMIIATAIPLTVGSVISVVTSFIDTVTVSNCIQIAYSGILKSKILLEKEAMRLTGILSKVDTLVNLPLAVNLSFYSALIPEITAAISKKDFKSASKKNIIFNKFIITYFNTMCDWIYSTCRSNIKNALSKCIRWCAYPSNSSCNYGICWYKSYNTRFIIWTWKNVYTSTCTFNRMCN